MKNCQITYRKILGAVIISIIVLSVVSSCIPSYTYPVHHQPPIELGEGPEYSLALVNSAKVAKFNFKRKKKNAVFADAVDYLDYHIVQELETTGNFNVVQDDSSGSGRRYFISAQPFDRDMISMFCAEHEVDYLVGLESFDAHFYKGLETTRDASGNKDRYANYTLAVVVDIALYDSSGSVLFRNQFYREMFYERRGVIIGILALGPQIQHAGAEIRTLCEGIVIDFISNYYPTVTVQTQFFYSDRAFTDAVVLMESAMWSEAINLLQPISKYEKDKTKGKACFNIAVCHKFLDDQKEAISWYAKAVRYLRRAPHFNLPYRAEN